METAAEHRSFTSFQMVHTHTHRHTQTHTDTHRHTHTHTHTTCSHTTCSHPTCSHPTWSHATCSHTHTHNLFTHNLSTHNLFTHNLLTHNLATSTFTLCGRHGTWRHRRAFCVAGVALMALGWLWWRAWVPFGAVVAAAVCVAGVALGDIGLDFVWQAWHLATSTCILRGRRGAYGAGLALVARLGPVWRRCRRGCLCGRGGTWRHRPSLCVAGVALMALGWLWWRAGVPFGALVVPLTLVLACLSHLPGGPETLCKLDCDGDILEV